MTNSVDHPPAAAVAVISGQEIEEEHTACGVVNEVLGETRHEASAGVRRR